MQVSVSLNRITTEYLETKGRIRLTQHLCGWLEHKNRNPRNTSGISL